MFVIFYQGKNNNLIGAVMTAPYDRCMYFLDGAGAPWLLLEEKLAHEV